LIVQGLGILLILGGIGYLVYDRIKNPPMEEAPPRATPSTPLERQATSMTPPSQREALLAAAQKRKLELQKQLALKRQTTKVTERRSVLSAFEEGATPKTTAKKPASGKPTASARPSKTTPAQPFPAKKPAPVKPAPAKPAVDQKTKTLLAKKSLEKADLLFLIKEHVKPGKVNLEAMQGLFVLLLKQKKLSKDIASEVLFELSDQSLISQKQLSSLMKGLGLI